MCSRSPLLLTPWETDDLLRFARGRSELLARKGRLPHITLPDGTIRFRRDEIDQLIGGGLPAVQQNESEVACA